MREVEKEAETTDEALEEALLELGVRRNEVYVEVLRKPSKGIFGIGGRKAKIRVALKGKGGADGSPREEMANYSSEEVREHAREATKNILDIIDIKHSIKVSETDSAIELDLNVEESQGLLIGKYGETLRNFEYIVSRIVASKTGKPPNRGKRISIDVNNYKREREKEIERKAVEAAKKVIESGRPFTFHRMQAYERKVVYTAVKDMSGIKFETKEDGNAKKITFLPASQDKWR
ncbi:Jag family protein [Candidatus Mycalebacterium sp.]